MNSRVLQRTRPDPPMPIKVASWPLSSLFRVQANPEVSDPSPPMQPSARTLWRRPSRRPAARSRRGRRRHGRFSGSSPASGRRSTSPPPATECRRRTRTTRRRCSGRARHARSSVALRCDVQLVAPPDEVRFSRTCCCGLRAFLATELCGPVDARFASALSEGQAHQGGLRIARPQMRTRWGTRGRKPNWICLQKLRYAGSFVSNRHGTTPARILGMHADALQHQAHIPPLSPPIPTA